MATASKICEGLDRSHPRVRAALAQWGIERLLPGSEDCLAGLLGTDDEAAKLKAIQALCRKAGWRWPLPVVASPARTGTGAQEIRAGNALIENSQRLPVAGGVTYGVAGWIRTQGLSGKGASLWLMWEDEAGRIKTEVVGWVSGTKPWTKLAGAYPAPPGAVQAQFLVAVEGGSGTAWFDDLEFLRVGR